MKQATQYDIELYRQLYVKNGKRMQKFEVRPQLRGESNEHYQKNYLHVLKVQCKEGLIYKDS